MTKYQRSGQKAINAYLKNCDTSSVMFFSLTVIADQAARDAGKKSDLFTSLYSYEKILPQNARTRWIGDDRGSVLHVLNPYHPDSASIPEFRPMAGPFDVAVDCFPLKVPRL